MISFLDADDNPMLVRLATERIQLAVVDSQPAIAGNELHAFATALFQTYVGPPLVERLVEADRHLVRAVSGGGMTPGQDARIEAARYAIAAVLAVVREPRGGAINPNPPLPSPRPAWLTSPAPVRHAAAPVISPAAPAARAAAVAAAPPPAAAAVPAAGATPAAAWPASAVTAATRARKPRTFRARDGYPLDWGWIRVAA